MPAVDVDNARVGASSISDAASMAYSNITILGPRDSISRRSWTQEVITLDFGDFWKYRAEFFFTTLLFCLNIGNLWRFPTQVIQYGEGAFIYVYLVFSLIFGIPLLFFEFSVGQYTDKGFVHVFRIIPLLEGLSYAMVLFSNTLVHVYDTITLYNFIYFFSFVRNDAPLSDRMDFGKMCFHENRSNTLENLHFLNEVVMVSDDSICSFNVRNLCITFVMWLVVWLYTTNEYATRPYVHSVKIYSFIISALIVTFIATLTVEGAQSGILRMLSPSWRNFLRFEVYLHAFEQSIITLGLGMGPLINFGSHTFFRTPIHIHAIFTVISTLVASLIMVMIIFGAIGVYSAEQGFSDAVLSGQEYYVHVLLSKLFRKMTYGLKHFIIFLFYGAFFAAGFYSSLQYTTLMIEFIRSKWDVNPSYNSAIILLFCICQSVISCGMISFHGINLLYWSAPDIFTTFSILTLVTLETIAFAFLYGMRHFCEDIVFMVGYRPNLWFKMVWYSSTVACSIALIASFLEYYYSSGTDWYKRFSIFMYIVVVASPITIHAIYTSATAFKYGSLSRIFNPREVQTGFQDYGNWKDFHSSSS